MRCSRKKRVTREEILEAIRKAAPSPAEWDMGKKRMVLRPFLAKSGLKESDIYGEFTSWNDALKEAGVDVPVRLAHVKTEELLVDWGIVTRKMQRPPPY